MIYLVYLGVVFSAGSIIYSFWSAAQLLAIASVSSFIVLLFLLDYLLDAEKQDRILRLVNATKSQQPQHSKPQLASIDPFSNIDWTVKGASHRVVIKGSKSVPSPSRGIPLPKNDRHPLDYR